MYSTLPAPVSFTLEEGGACRLRKPTGGGGSLAGFHPYVNMPDVRIKLLSPTSVRMKNSFLIVNGATKNHELFRKS